MKSFLLRLERFFKDWTLLIAIILGIAFHDFFGFVDRQFQYLLPVLIFTMLFLSFSKLEGFSGKDGLMHVLVVVVQLVFGAATYFLVRPYDEVLAVGISICVFVSPATSSPVVVNLMRGNMAFSTEFLLIDSVLAAFILPFWLAYVGGGCSPLDMAEAVKAIASNTLVVVLVPLCVALAVKKFVPKSKEVIKRFSFMNYYLWAFALMIIMGRSIDVFLSEENPDYRFAVQAFGLSFIVCFILIMGGKLLGGNRQTGISIGQALGQKNTVLAIWLASNFLHPMSVLVPTMWIISQNIINSIQVWHANRSNVDGV